MLEGLLRMEGGDQIPPFVRMFYSGPSTYLWEDEMGVTQHIAQGEGGEQGDPPHAHVVRIGPTQVPRRKHKTRLFDNENFVRVP